MRGYKDSNTTYLDWSVGELDSLSKAYKIREEDNKLFYRKIRSDYAEDVSDSEVTKAIAVLDKKLVKDKGEVESEYGIEKTSKCSFILVILLIIVLGLFTYYYGKR